MQNAWNGTPYYWVNAYIGGLNRTYQCSFSNLTSSWVTAVHGQGWRLVPTWVDYQAPCEDQPSYGATMSSDGNTAYNQGASAAQNAATAAQNLGIGPGSILYDDIEDFSGSSNCYLAVANFVNGWATELKALGFRSGVYESACCSDLLSLCSYVPFITPPNDIWIAAWDQNSSVSDISSLPPSGCWTGQQRLHQYCNSGAGCPATVPGISPFDLDSSNGEVAY